MALGELCSTAELGKYGRHGIHVITKSGVIVVFSWGFVQLLPSHFFNMCYVSTGKYFNSQLEHY